MIYYIITYHIRQVVPPPETRHPLALLAVVAVVAVVVAIAALLFGP